MWCVVFLQAMFRIESEIFQSQFGNPRISPFEFLLGTACWSKKQDTGILTGNATRIFIFYGNVTCFGTNGSCWNRSHLPEFFIKAPHFLLAWLLCFFTQTPRFYIFLGGDLCNTHDCPGQNNSHFGLEFQGWKMSCVFFGMASSRVLFLLRHGEETSTFGKVSGTLLSKQSNSLWHLPISVRKSTNIAPWVLIRHCFLIEEIKRWNAGWQR